jgi:O-antigen ligase
MDTFILPKFFVMVLGAGVLGALVSPYFVQFWKNGYRVPIIFSIIFLISIILSSIFSKQSFILTILGSFGRSNGTLFYFSLVIIFISVVFVASEKFYHNLLVTLSVSGLILTVYGFFQILGVDFVEWRTFKKIAILTLGNSNFANVFIAFSLIATFYLFICNSGQRKYFYLASFLLQVYLISISTDLQGKLISTLSIILFIALILQANVKSIYRKLAAIWWIALSFGVVILSVGLLGVGPGVKILQSNLGSFKDRTYHWVAAWEMFKSQPIFGIGIDSFRDSYRIFRSEEAINFRGSVDGWTSNAHNLFFQFLSTGGIVLLTGYVVLLLFVFYRYLITIRKLNNPKTKLLFNAYFVLWVAYQLNSFISIDMPTLALWGWVFSASLIGISYIAERAEVSSVPKGGYASVNFRPGQGMNFLKIASSNLFYITLVFTLIPSCYILSQIYFEYDYKQTRKSFISAESIEQIKIDGADLYLQSLRFHHVELRLDAIVKLLERDLGDQALSLAIQATKDFPKSFGAWNAVASIYEGSNNFKAAIPARRMSIKLDPQNTNLVSLLNQNLAQAATTP